MGRITDEAFMHGHYSDNNGILYICNKGQCCCIQEYFQVNYKKKKKTCILTHGQGLSSFILFIEITAIFTGDFVATKRFSFRK